jgi:hypothetical protein
MIPVERLSEHFRALSLLPGSSLAEVRAAFDRESRSAREAEDAERMRKVTEAYRVLAAVLSVGSDMSAALASRRAFRTARGDSAPPLPSLPRIAPLSDATGTEVLVLPDAGASGGQDEASGSDPEAAADGPSPLRCQCCTVETPQLRYVEIRAVAGWVLGTSVVERRQVLCRRCAEALSAGAALLTWSAGWWSPTGLLSSPGALWQAFRCGRLPKHENLRLLVYQSGAYMAAGRLDLAVVAAKQARSFASGDDLASLDALLSHPSAAEQPEMRDAWRSGGFTRLLRHLTLPAFVALCFSFLL